MQWLWNIFWSLPAIFQVNPRQKLITSEGNLFKLGKRLKLSILIYNQALLPLSLSLCIFCDSTWVENHWFWDPGGNLCLEIVPDRLRNYFGCIGDQVLQVITLSESSISSRFADSEGELRNFKVNISHICTTSFRSPETRLPALHLLRIRYCTQMVNSFGFQYVCSWMMTSNRKIAFLGNVFFHTNPQFKFCFVEVKPCL